MRCEQCRRSTLPSTHACALAPPLSSGVSPLRTTTALTLLQTQAVLQRTRPQARSWKMKSRQLR